MFNLIIDQYFVIIKVLTSTQRSNDNKYQLRLN